MRFTSVKFVPTASSLGLNAGYWTLAQVLEHQRTGVIKDPDDDDKFLLSNNQWINSLNVNWANLSPRARELKKKLELLDPELINPAALSVTLHAGRFASAIDYLDPNQVLPEYRAIIAEQTREWQDGLRIHFDIEHRGTSQRGITGDMSIWNLSEGSLRVIKAGALIEISSGYDFYNKNIFTGVVKEVKSERDGGDIRTKIKLQGTGVSALNVPAPVLGYPGANEVRGGL